MGDPEGARAAMQGHCEIRVSLGQHSALRDTMGTNSPLVFIQDGPSVQHKMTPQLQTEGSWEGGQVRCEVNRPRARPLEAGQTEVWQLPLGILGLPSSRAHCNQTLTSSA